MLTAIMLCKDMQPQMVTFPGCSKTEGSSISTPAVVQLYASTNRRPQNVPQATHSTRQLPLLFHSPLHVKQCQVTRVQNHAPSLHAKNLRPRHSVKLSSISFNQCREHSRHLRNIHLSALCKSDNVPLFQE